MTPEMLAAMSEAGAPGAASWAAGDAAVPQGLSLMESMGQAGNGAKNFLFGSPGGSQMTAQTAQALAGGQGAPLFGTTGATPGGILGQFSATPAQQGLLSMGAGPTSMGGIAAEMGAPVASGASVQPFAGQSGLLSGMNWQKAGMQGVKMAGQALTQQPQAHAGGGSTQGPYAGMQGQPLAPQNTQEAYRQKRDALLKRMLGH